MAYLRLLAAVLPVCCLPALGAVAGTGGDPALRLSLPVSDGKLVAGKPLNLQLSVMRDGYVACFYEDANGLTTRVFPNVWSDGDHVDAGQNLTMPDPLSPYQIVPEVPGGRERFACVYAEAPPLAALPPHLLPELKPLIQPLDTVLSYFTELQGYQVALLTLQVAEDAPVRTRSRAAPRERPPAAAPQTAAPVPAPAPAAAPRPAAPPVVAAAPPSVVPALAPYLTTDHGQMPTIKALTPLVVMATAPAAGHMACFYTAADGTVARIFPNPSHPRTAVAKGETIRVPASGTTFQIVPEKPGSEEEIACLYSPSDLLDALPPLVAEKELEALPVASIDLLVREVRRQLGPSVGDARVLVRVAR